MSLQVKIISRWTNYLHAHDVAEVSVAAVQHRCEDEELFPVGVRVVQRGDAVDPSPGQLGRLAIFLEHFNMSLEMGVNNVGDAIEFSMI